MRKILFIGFGLTVACSAAMMFVACGGGTSTDATASDEGGSGAGADGSGGGGGGGGGGSEGGSATDAGGGGGGKDSGGGGSTVDGGAASDPGKVACGATTCATATDFCCTTFQFDGGRTATCDKNGTACAGSAMHCNEAADCDGGVCCEQGGTSSCKATCGIGSRQLCKSSGECGVDGGGCNVLTCGGGGMGVVVEVCGHPFGCK